MKYLAPQRAPLRRTSTRVLLIVALALTTFSVDGLYSQGQSAARSRRIVVLDGREVVEGEVIVRYRPESGRIGRERAEFQAESVGSETIGQLGARRLQSRVLSTRQLMEVLRANPDVELVEPNYIIRANAIPNDPELDQQWGLVNNGQVIEGRAGVAGADIGAAAAWDVTTGSRNHIVAILDSGVDFTHPDLAANMFSAPRQFTVTIGSLTVTCAAGTHGFNAISSSCVPLDDYGHGTHVAGIIGAVGNNNVGVTGVNWTANIMALKVLDATGTGTTADAIKAIEFAIKAKAALGADGNVRILNASWGGPTFSQSLDDEIRVANNAEMLFVASAGSNSSNNDTVGHYPSSSAAPNVVSVAALDNSGQLASYSNYGASSVDLGAPGSSTFSTLPNNAYDYLTGTSMAAPFVSGAAALVLSVCPANTATLKSHLLNSTRPVTSLTGKTVSGGRLDVGNAVVYCRLSPTITLQSASVPPGGTITFEVKNGSGHPHDWVGLFAVNAPDTSHLQWKYLNNTQSPPATGLTTATLQFAAPQTPGTYEIRWFASGGFTRVATSNGITVATQPLLAINDVSVTEGNSGTVNATFTVTLSAPITAQTVTVNYATANGSATANTDYTPVTGTLTFAPSVTTQTFIVPVIGDTTAEPTETFLVNLSNATNVSIGDGQGVGTIVTDDTPPGPAITLQSTSVQPGGNITFDVTNGPGNPTDFVALYAAGAPDTSFLQWKYLNNAQSPPASGITNTTLQFGVPSAGTYNIRLFNNGTWTKLATSANFVAATQPPQPQLSINDVTVTEGNSGTVTATFTVTLSPVNNSQSVTVNYATANGTATTANNDYSATNGTLTFAPGVGTQTITVAVVGDTAVESTETFFVNLSNAINATIGDGQGGGTIVSDDAPPGPAITLQSTSIAAGGTITFDVTNGPGNATDFVALYVAGAGDTSYLQWKYLNNAQSPPASGITNTTLQFMVPSAGTYNIRLFANGTWTILATSANFTVVQP
jgi:thermitase